MTLADDLKGPVGRQFVSKVDKALAVLDEADRTALLDALRDSEVPVNHVAKACKRNGLDLGNVTIQNWREANGTR